MKVIVAGLPKTGTKSVNAALQRLGYNVYDLIEGYTFLKKDWKKICLEGGNTEDFRRMYEDVDAVTDLPSCNFWEEIHEAFPHAKIILTVRSSEEEWIRSKEKQVVAGNLLSLKIMQLISPTYRSLIRFTSMIVTTTFGTDVVFPWFGEPRLNKLLMLMAYRRHNTYVIQSAPKEKLLVYNVKEGWEPLCKFLEVEIPNEPFPRKDIRESFVAEWMAKQPTLIRVKREIYFFSFVSVSALAFGVYKLMKVTDK